MSFIDSGANIGAHAFNLACSGVPVFAVEPLTINLVKLYHSAYKSGCGHNIRLYRNYLASSRGMTESMEPRKGNIGASSAGKSRDYSTSGEKIKSVLLSQIIQEAVDRVNDDTVRVLIIKLDIEHWECEALLGSADIFQMDSVFIPYLVMEWNFCSLSPNRRRCDRRKVRNLTELLRGFSYEPFRLRGWKKLKYSQSEDWNSAAIVWKHKTTH